MSRTPEYLNATQIARQAGCSAPIVRQLAAEQGVVHWENSPWKLSQSEAETIMQAIKDGKRPGNRKPRKLRGTGSTPRK